MTVCACVRVCFVSGKTLFSVSSCFCSNAANCVFNYGKRPAVQLVTLAGETSGGDGKESC